MMIQRFSEVLKRSPRDGVTVHAGISYGNHERNAFDVFLPESMATPPPVVLFVHGGAFVSGRRNRTEQIYSNVLYYLARHGIAGINIGYRLAHDAVYPAATNDISTLVAWAEFENPLIDVYCAELVYRLAHAKRKAPPSMWLAKHNHTSSIGQIGTSDDALGQAIVDFVGNPR